MTREKASPSPVNWRSWPSRVSSTGASCHPRCRRCPTAPRAGTSEPRVPWPSVTSWNSPGCCHGEGCSGMGHWPQHCSMHRGVLLPAGIKASEAQGLTQWSIEASYSPVCTGTRTSGRSPSESGWWRFTHFFCPFNPKCCIPFDLAVLTFINNCAWIVMFCYSFALGHSKWKWAVELSLFFVTST